MANTVNMKLTVETKGLEEANRLASKVADNMERANKAGGTMGSKKASQAGYSPSQAAGLDNQEYNRARGSMGTTGASARDFANQAQGLGGLVRVYATFAANIFAASAAFSALREAANTTNMVKGLDQLGAASGRNLGSVAKDLVKVTDGAITLREAMEATAKATAAGMSNENLKRLTVGAKNAAQALGLNMSDALSRLTRGVTKLEPELLDELGIFVRVDTAAQRYAQSIGKATSSLTEFERRSAFAAEVLGQVETKFGALNLEANPYDKLLASLKEAAQAGLEFANKVIGPIANFLSSSPTALATVIAGIATILLKQAIPAFGMFQENARRMSKETTERVKRLVEENVNASVYGYDKIGKAAEKAFETSETALKKVAALPKTFNQKVLGRDVRGLLKLSPFELTDDDLNRIRAKQEQLEKRNDEAGKRELARLKQWNAEYRALMQERASVGDAAAEAAANRSYSAMTTSGQQEMYLKRLRASEKKYSIVSTASDIAATLGPAEALRNLNEQVKKSDLSGMQKIGTTIRGAFGIATAAISTFMNAFGVWIAVAGVAIAGISYLFEKMSSSGEQAKRASEGFDTLNASIENASRTIDVINKKDMFGAMSVESIQARANALNDLTDSMSGLTKSVQSQLNAMNGWDKFAEGFKSFFGGGVVKNFNETLANSFGKSLELSERDPKLLKGLEGIFGKAIDSSAQLEAELNKLPEALRNQKWDALIALQKELNLSKNNAASLSTTMVASLDAANKAQKDLENSYKASDKGSQYGNTLVQSARDTIKALEDGKNTAAELQKLLDDPSKLKVFDVDSIAEILKYNDKLKDNIRITAEQEKALAVVNARIKEQSELYTARSKAPANDARSKASKDEALSKIQAEIDKLKKSAEAIKLNFSVDSSVVENLAAKFKAAAEKQLKSGLELMLAGSNAEVSKANAVFAQGIASMLGDTETGIKLRTDLIKQQNNIQIQLLKAQIAHITASANQTIAIRENTVELRKQDPNSDANDMRSIAKEVAQIERDKAFLNNPNASVNSMKDVTQSVVESFLSVRGINAQIKSAQATNSLEDVKSELDIRKLAQKTNEENSRALVKEKTKEIDALNTIISLNETIDLQALKRRQELEKERAELEYQAEIDKIRAEIADKVYLLQKAPGVSAQALAKDPEFVKLGDRLEKLSSGKVSTDTQSNIKNVKETNLAIAKNANVELDKQLQKEKQLYDLGSKKLDYDSKSLDYLKSIEAISDSFYQQRKGDLEITKINADYEQAANENALSATKDLVNLIATRTTLETLGRDLTVQEQAQLAITNQQIADRTNKVIEEQAALKQVRDLNVDIAAKTRDAATAIALQKEVMDQMKSTTESLSALFGEMGENIGKAAEAMLELSQNAEKRKLAEEKLNADPKASEKEREALRQKNAKAELSDIAKAAAANKKMFGEKTAAYKVLNGIERAAHAQKVAMQVMEAAAQAKNIGEQISSGMKYLSNLQEMIAKDGIAAVIKQGVGGDPWTAIPRMAAMAAFVSALIGEPVNANVPTGPSNEDVQKAQLTGQMYDAGGNLVNTGYGAYGDPTANVKGIQDSIDTLGKVFFNSMGNRSSSLLTYLREIQDNTAATVSAIITSSGGTGQLGPGVRVPGESINSPGAGFASIPVIGGMLSGLIDGLFGGSKSVSNLESQNLRIRSANLETVANNQISGFYDSLIKTVTESSFLFWKSTSVSYRNQIDNLDTNVLGKISKIFQAFNASMFEVAKGLGGTEADMLKTLRSISGNIDINIQGMSGAQIGEALGAQLTIKMNQVIATAFPWVKSLTKAGEEFSAAAARLIKADETIKVGLGLIDQTLEGFNTEQRVRRQQELLTKFGGSLEDFVTAVESYYDKFFSEQDKLQSKYEDVRSRMSELGYAGVTTEEQFKQLVSSIDLTTYSGQTLFKQLLDIAPAFDDVAESIKQVAQERDGLVERMYELTGNTTALKQLKRAKILENLDPTNRKLQEYLFALEDMKEAETKLATARKKANQTTIATINSTVTSLEGFVKSIANFRDSLKISVQSPLTPQEKYAEARSQFDDLMQIVNTVVTPGSDAEKERNDAINKLQGLATTFLDLSKAYNASSMQYVSDYDMVQAALASTESILSAQLSDAQIQQSQLQAIIDAEEVTASATVTVAEGVTLLNTQMASVTAALQAWLLSDQTASGYGAEAIAISEVPQFASGGYASGLALVGEEGPELVNFRNPGQVYNANQTAGMFGTNQQLIEEVRQLRAEVQKLREQQHKETGALITATFDAQTRNADTVADAVQDAAKTQIWNAKVQQSVVLV